jgi:hypothetical protein
VTPIADAASRLDERICFALYEASRAITASCRELLAPLGVTCPQCLALLVPWETDRIAVSELGDRLRLDSGTLSALLRRLEKPDVPLERQYSRRGAADDESRSLTFPVWTEIDAFARPATHFDTRRAECQTGPRTTFVGR